MKKVNSLKKFLFALAFVFSLTAFIPAVGQMEIQAKTRKITANANWEKAPVMKKVGTYAVTAKKNFSHISFVAPKNGTYKFTISSIKTLGTNYTGLGNFYPHNYNGYAGVSINVKTEGGRSTCLFTASANYDTKFVNSGMKKVSQYLKKRSATIKLKKGQKIWFEYFYTGGNKCSYKVNVKKVK